LEIIDAQIHEPVAGKPFDPPLDPATRDAVHVELAREAIDSVRVDRAVVVARPAFNEACIARYPELFAAVEVMDHTSEELEARMAGFRARKGMLGCRTLVTNYAEVRRDPDVALRLNDTFLSGGFDRYWALAARHDIPMFFSAHGFATALRPLAERHPELTIIVDHFGITQSLRREIEGDRWAALPGLLELARYPNVFVKWCGVPLVSRAAFPHDDVWPQLHRILRAFGPERCMWASDFTRLRWGVPDRAGATGAPPRADWKSYADALHHLLHTREISRQDKEQLFSGAVRRALRWTRED
jgi:predicted TIM-barrel fold metal-dependent hydrolase